MSSLPQEIIAIIMFFAINPQPRHLLDDIKSYSTASSLKRIYEAQEDFLLNPLKVMLRDIYFAMNDHKHGIQPHLRSVFARVPRFNPYRPRTHSTQINMMWALMLPEERSKFYHFVVNKKYRIGQKRVYAQCEDAPEDIRPLSVWTTDTATIQSLADKIQLHHDTSRKVRFVTMDPPASAAVLPQTLVKDVWHPEAVFVFSQMTVDM